MMNKKALSLMVSFVLLVGMSVALAGMVYAWLKFYVQKPFPEESCPEVSIIIYNYTCSNPTVYPRFITLNVQNRGFFNISGFMVKINDKAENEEGGGIAGRFSLPCKEYSISPGQIQKTVFQFPLSTIQQIEIEPFLGTCAKPALCDKAILRQSITNC
jgi:hypothetical protein